MRISSGHFKGRVLQSVPGSGTRPTDARAREMLFNVLGERILEARVLDLYGGTGSVGLEALSRGADFCVFIEQNAGACRTIKANLKTLRVEGAAQVWQSTVKSALRRLTADGQSFDLIFADPPFDNVRELGYLCKALDMAAPLLHNKARRQPATSSTPHLLSHSSSGTPASQTAAGREERQADEELSEALFFPQVLAPADLGLGAGSEHEGEVAEPEHVSPELLEPLERMLVIQHQRKQSPTLAAPFRLWREKHAGESTFSFFVLDEIQGAAGEDVASLRQAAS